MNWADWSILAILGVSVVISVVRGFVREAMSLAVWVAAFVLAMLFHEKLAVWYTNLISTPSIRYMAAWITLFIAVLLVGGLVNYLLGKLVQATGLSGTDRLLGMLFGAVRGLIIVMAILILLPSIVPVEKDLWWHESRLIPRFLEFESWARDVATQVTGFFTELF